MKRKLFGYIKRFWLLTPWEKKHLPHLILASVVVIPSGEILFLPSLFGGFGGLVAIVAGGLGGILMITGIRWVGTSAVLTEASQL